LPECRQASWAQQRQRREEYACEDEWFCAHAAHKVSVNPIRRILLKAASRFDGRRLDTSRTLAAMQPLGISIIFGALFGLLAALVIGALPSTATPKAMALSSAYVMPLPAALPGSMLGRPVL